MSRWARGATLATFGAVLLMPSMLRPIAASADDGCPVLGPGCVVDTVDPIWSMARRSRLTRCQTSSMTSATV